MHTIDVLLNTFQTLVYSASFYYIYNKNCVFTNKTPSRIIMLTAFLTMTFFSISIAFTAQPLPSQSILGVPSTAAFMLIYGLFFITAFATNNKKLVLFGYSIIIVMLMRLAIEIIKNKQFGAFQLSMLAAPCLLLLLLHISTESKKKHQTSVNKA